MKAICVGALLLLSASVAFAQRQQSTYDIMAEMQSQLDLSNDQVASIRPVIEKYTLAMEDLQQSIAQGSINPSAIDSQRQGLEDQETQELSQYLKPYQLSEWRSMQGQVYARQSPGMMDNSESDSDLTDQDQYTNLPNNNKPQE